MEWCAPTSVGGWADAVVIYICGANVWIVLREPGRASLVHCELRSIAARGI
jgi:hypothetical protein